MPMSYEPKDVPHAPKTAVGNLLLICCTTCSRSDVSLILYSLGVCKMNRKVQIGMPNNAYSKERSFEVCSDKQVDFYL